LRHVEIHHGDMRVYCGVLFYRFVAVGGFATNGPIVLGFNQKTQLAADVIMIIHKKNLWQGPPDFRTPKN
jgi:hypothetical protein